MHHTKTTIVVIVATQPRPTSEMTYVRLVLAQLPEKRHKITVVNAIIPYVETSTKSMISETISVYKTKMTKSR